MKPEFITEECFAAAMELQRTIDLLRDKLATKQMLADKVAISRDIARLRRARRVALGLDVS